MFRKLFALETAALHASEDAAQLRQDQPAHPLGDSLRDLARLTATPSRYGMWSTRASV